MTTELTFTSELTVIYVDHMGDDERIIDAAQVRNPNHLRNRTPEKSEGIRRTLTSKRHGTPFEHGALTVFVHAPIKVFREWLRHRIGWSYNEESGRYKQLDPVFYIPPLHRPAIRPPDFKSMDPAFDMADEAAYGEMVKALKAQYSNSYIVYEHLLRLGIDRGLARDILGVGIYSSMYATANPRSLMHFLELRTNVDYATRPSKPLWEMEQCAIQVEAIFRNLWPKTWALWDQNERFRRVAP